MTKSQPAIVKASAIGIPAGYPALLQGIKQRIRAAQVRAALSANAELVHLYWDIGRVIAERQQQMGWGAAIIPRLSCDLRNELPEVEGFSERNIKSMLAFHLAYADLAPIVQQPAAQLPSPTEVPQAAAQLHALAEFLPPVVAKSPHGNDRLIVQQPVAQLPGSLLWAIPWGHHLLLMLKLKHLPTRLWYMRETIANGWSRNTLALQIDARAHQRHGKAINNFAAILPPPQSDLAAQTLKDPYIFDFLTLEQPFHERELETGLLAHVQKFLLELGQGFAFVGRQYRIEIGGEDFYIDLLFYHLRLRCFIVIDLKKGPFKAEYAGKMNFYCNLVDDRLLHPADQPTIGLILCQEKNRMVAEYALKGMNKAIGVSKYELTRALPRQLRSSLPTIEQIETELTVATAKSARQRRSS